VKTSEFSVLLCWKRGYWPLARFVRHDEPWL